MQQAQKMQENMKRLQDELAQIEVEGPGGRRMVKVVMTCRTGASPFSIDPSLVGDDRDMLEDLVAAAFNDAVRAPRRRRSQKMSTVTRRHADAPDSSYRSDDGGARLGRADAVAGKSPAVESGRGGLSSTALRRRYPAERSPPAGSPLRNHRDAGARSGVLRRQRRRAMKLGPTLDKLVDSLKRLPGIGPRSAQRSPSTCCSMTVTARWRSGRRCWPRPAVSATAPAATP